MIDPILADIFTIIGLLATGVAGLALARYSADQVFKDSDYD